MGFTRRSILAALAATAIATLAAASPAIADEYPEPCRSFVTGTPVEHPRVVGEQLRGVPFNVLLPPGYARSSRRYPVVYLLNSALGDQDEYLSETDLIAFTGNLPRSKQAIVVLPFGGLFGFYSDWRDGSQRWESFHTRRLIPHVDRRYRTIARRSQRAIAGFSMGGFGAMSYAARHPDLFAAAGSFSGTLDPVAPTVASFIPEFLDLVNSVCDRADDPAGIWGDLATDEIVWRDHDPTDLAPNLRGTSIYAEVGDSDPCEPDELNENPLAGRLEEMSRVAARNFQAALRRAQVPHEVQFRPCGTHVYRYVQQGLHAWWPRMARALGRSASRSFSHRRADRVFSARGWSFRADPRRALEFLHVRRASRRGLTLTGSGTQTVKTSAYFNRGERISVSGTRRKRSVTADRRGRISIKVDLGPAHRHQQYTAGAREAGQGLGDYFTTRRVRFGRHAR
jgi:S-formylglutathione hydrolase FrmB